MNYTKILLRSSWQTRNIGDIAHTPGILQILEKYRPEAEITLWPCEVNRGVKEMLMALFPKLKIVEGASSSDAVQEAFCVNQLFLHGSGPGIDVAGIEAWRRQEPSKSYGMFGVSAGGLWSPEKREAFDGASFIYCRDSISRDFLRDQKLRCPVIEFAPDATFGLRLRNEAPAVRFLKENRLEDAKFICVIPRLRYTPATEENGQYIYATEERRRGSEENVDSDMEKMNYVIGRILRETSLKILICPEMTYEVSMGRKYLYEKVPAEYRDRVVWRDSYWLTDEAQSVYSRAHSLVSMEMHSPIIFVSEGLPAVLLRQSQDTWKGQMWRDVGLGRWILELDNVSGEEIADTVLEIVPDYAGAKAKAARALEYALGVEKYAIHKLGETQ